MHDENANPAGVDDDDDDEDDEDYNPDDDDDEDDNNYYSPLAEDDEEDHEEEEQEEAEDNDDDDDETPGVGTEEDIETPGVGTEEEEEDEEDVTTPGVGNDDDEVENEEEEEEEYEMRNTTAGNMNLRKQKRKEYDVFNMTDVQDDEEIIMLHFDTESDDLTETEFDRLDAEYLFLTETLGWKDGLDSEIDAEERTQNDISPESVTKLAEYLFLTEQMGWKKGLTIFKEEGEKAIDKELRQIHDMEGFQPKHWYELTEEERAKALRYLMYLKEKRDGRIKGRGCADGRPQRLYTTKIESSSPTACLAALLLTCMIDAFENRDVATVDIPGAFLQTKMPEVLKMKRTYMLFSTEEWQNYLQKYLQTLTKNTCIIAVDKHTSTASVMLPSMGPSRLHCCFGRSSQQVSSLVDSSSTTMIGAWLTR